MTTSRMLWSGLIVVGVLAATPGALAQSDWDLPEGADPPGGDPAPLPAVAVGPVTFSEVEFTPGATVDGFMVNTLGGSPLPAPLSFGFSSADATFSNGPGNTMYVQDPSIEGTTMGTLTIDFGFDVTSAVFGFALSCPGPITDGATAQAFDSSNSPVGSPSSEDATDLGFGFAENQLTVAPGGGFRSISVTFDPSQVCSRFVFDNLGYDDLGVPAVRPLVLVLLLTVLLVGTLLVLRRRSG